MTDEEKITAAREWLDYQFTRVGNFYDEHGQVEDVYALIKSLEYTVAGVEDLLTNGTNDYDPRKRGWGHD